ncbi:MAG: hypothetical protein IJX53_01180 [Clostridia bacterium]|nr:hypothetical protein [Clostridia bacterium]
MADKMQGGEIRIENRFTRWIDNYWYYYKWPVLIGAFALIVVLVCTVQMCAKETPDVNVVYAGSHSFGQQGPSEVAAAFSALMPEDYNGDGRKEVAVTNLLVYSEAQIRAQEEAALAEGENLVVNSSFFAQEKQKFSQLLMSGEYTIVLAADWLYEEMKGTGIFLPLAEALGTAPEGAYDDCAIYLKDTAFGQYFTALAALPEDTLICYRRQGSLGTLLNQDKAERTYLNGLDTFRAVMNFDAE